MPISANEYVVLDVETNGLSSLRDDLLSISLYQPDTQKIYNRFLPLELNNYVYTTHINGITKKALAKAKPLSQQEVDELLSDFDLENRTILTYGSLDEKFIKNYFKRKGLVGYEKLHFFNFKHNIISSRFSEGNITKDNLCLLYGIENVQEIHTGVNDCLLEWQLFEKLNGNKLLITRNSVFELNDSYIVPASYLSTYPNFKYHTHNLPHFKCETTIIKKFEIVSNSIKKFPTNFNGLTIEHLINVMLEVEKIDSKSFLVENKKKLKRIGGLPSILEEIPMSFNSDGTVSSINKKDKELADELNTFLLAIKKELFPLIDYIKNCIFKNQHIFSQELVVHKDKNVLALCDLSSDSAVLEIKTYKMDVNKSADQLFYESNGRNCYIMQIDWSQKKQAMCFYISKVTFKLDENKQTDSLQKRINNFRNRITNKGIDVLEYVDSDSRVTLRCKKCGNTFSKAYNSMLKNSNCPHCASQSKPQSRSAIKNVLTPGEKQSIRANRYSEKINNLSNGQIEIINYIGSKDKVVAYCKMCAHEWSIRADHLLNRPYCPLCKKQASTPTEIH